MGEVLKVTQRLPRFCNLFYIFELKVCDGTRFIAIDRIRRRVKKNTNNRVLGGDGAKSHAETPRQLCFFFEK